MKNTFKAFVIFEDKTSKITNMNFSELRQKKTRHLSGNLTFQYKLIKANVNK